MQLYVSDFGMKINALSTKLLTAEFIPAEKQPIVLNCEILKELNRFKYRGFIVSVKNRGEEDINC